jgi:hypothetical protein
MKKSNILTKMMSPGVYTTEIDISTSKTYWLPFKRKQKLNKIMDKIVIDVQITPKKPLEYITLDLNPTPINIKRQKKIKSILSEIHL